MLGVLNRRTATGEPLPEKARPEYVGSDFRKGSKKHKKEQEQEPPEKSQAADRIPWNRNDREETDKESEVVTRSPVSTTSISDYPHNHREPVESIPQLVEQRRRSEPMVEIGDGGNRSCQSHKQRDPE